MSYSYNQFIVNLANYLVVSTTDPGYVAALPTIIDNAEQRIYRDIDLANTVMRDASASLTTGTRTFNLPAINGTFYVLNEIYVITPAGQTVPDGGTRNPMTPVSRPFLDVTFPSSNGSGVPQYFAMTTQTSIIVGPWPDQSYQVEVSGTIRPTPLSVSNQTTLLSAYLSDLFFAAAMVEGAGYQQNFSASGDNPQFAPTWEARYKAALASAQIEEARKKFTAEGWSSKQPSQIVTPPRT